jgi:EAL domain-containing protein (putative c-di-GMP-specific phosphodiesterase class I)
MEADGLLRRLLEPSGLRTAFQPIMRRRESGWSLQGFEGLVRGPAETNLADAEVLFEYVRRKRAEAVVDRRAVEEILKAAAAFGPPVYLTANVHAATLEQDAGFPGFLERMLEEYWINPRRFTLEIVEHSPSRCGNRFLNALDGVRDLGCTIALDDVGLGYANYRMMLDVRPDCFKIDRYVMHGVHADYYRRAVVRSIVELAGSFGAYAVAEGIDSVADLETALAEGVASYQGYLFGRPAQASQFGKWDLACSAAEQLPRVAEAHEWAGHRDWLLRSSALLTRASSLS